MPRRTRRLVIAGTITLAVLTAPAAALAGTASVGNSVASYQADSGEDNSVAVSESPHPTNAQLKVVTFRDVVPVQAGAGCASDSTFIASCNVPISSVFVAASLGNLSDGLQPSSSLVSMGFSAQGGNDGDRLIGTARRDVLEAGPGEDLINGGGGNDYIDAGIHDDRVVGGTGIDVMFGYYGDDTINAGDNAPDDEINCGPGYDTAIFDSGDKVNSNCEVLVFQ